MLWWSYRQVLWRKWAIILEMQILLSIELNFDQREIRTPKRLVVIRAHFAKVFWSRALIFFDSVGIQYDYGSTNQCKIMTMFLQNGPKHLDTATIYLES
jgi:hypothetical protein